MAYGSSKPKKAAKKKPATKASKSYGMTRKHKRRGA